MQVQLPPYALLDYGVNFLDRRLNLCSFDIVAFVACSVAFFSAINRHIFLLFCL